MGKLWEIVREHVDSSMYPPSERQVAKRLGISPTALANWRHPKSLPAAENLRSLARLTGQPYSRVLDAALEDAGYLAADVPTEAAVPAVGQEDLDLAAYVAPREGTELERWDARHAVDGEEDQDRGSDEPA